MGSHFVMRKRRKGYRSCSPIILLRVFLCFFSFLWLIYFLLLGVTFHMQLHVTRMSVFSRPPFLLTTPVHQGRPDLKSIFASLGISSLFKWFSNALKCYFRHVIIGNNLTIMTHVCSTLRLNTIMTSPDGASTNAPYAHDFAYSVNVMSDMISRRFLHAHVQYPFTHHMLLLDLSRHVYLSVYIMHSINMCICSVESTTSKRVHGFGLRPSAVTRARRGTHQSALLRLPPRGILLLRNVNLRISVV